MQINLEAADYNSIQAYSDQEIIINSQSYHQSLVASRHEIISDWPISSIKQLNEKTLEPLLRHEPRVIILGHKEQTQLTTLPFMQALTKRGIGLELMSLGAACRTYNLLLNEHREVVIGVIL